TPHPSPRRSAAAQQGPALAASTARIAAGVQAGRGRIWGWLACGAVIGGCPLPAMAVTERDRGGACEGGQLALGAHRGGISRPGCREAASADQGLTDACRRGAAGRASCSA